MIYKFRDPRLPQFLFEWHEGAGRVYRIDAPGAWLDGEFVPDAAALSARGLCVAEHAGTHAQAYGLVQTFCRGYLKAVCDLYAGRAGAVLPERIKEGDPCPTR